MNFCGFLGPRTNTEVARKFQLPLHAVRSPQKFKSRFRSSAGTPKLIPKFRSNAVNILNLFPPLITPKFHFPTLYLSNLYGMHPAVCYTKDNGAACTIIILKEIK
jgi:hypothetical protein